MSMEPEDLNVTPDFTEKIEAPKLAIQIMFDALCASLDFGSGFLDTEEVHALREVARILGVDPMTATPSNFRSDFPHPFKTWEIKDYNGVRSVRPECHTCGKALAHRVHEE
jgi:hypothetical protein